MDIVDSMLDVGSEISLGLGNKWLGLAIIVMNEALVREADLQVSPRNVRGPPASGPVTIPVRCDISEHNAFEVWEALKSCTE